jgi:UDP-2,4-diacetamido-2,4,6-trideoxy-beta-L-altropyranose hydrolase
MRPYDGKARALARCCRRRRGGRSFHSGAGAIIRAVFRVDASSRIGSGHLTRCLTLAEGLRARGADTRFVCRSHPDGLIELPRQRGLAVRVLPEPHEPHTGAVAERYADWLGVTQAEDADQTIQALQRDHPEWLIVDHYGLGSVWERRLRGHAGKLMIVDDLANRQHDCDLLLDQNYSTGSAARYRELVPEMAALALGPRYALLRPEYLQHRLVLRERDGQVRRVLVFFGGSDSYNMTGMTLAALSGAEFDRLEVDVVIGPNNVHRARLERAIAERPLTTAHGHRPHLADLMSQADLAIGAGGTTTWERLCLGLPSLAVSIAENQEPTCQALAGVGLMRYLGRHGEVQPSMIASALRECIGEPEALVELSGRSRLAVDGLGTMRLVEYLDPTPAKLLRLRPAAPDDELLYFAWANDPEVRRQAISTDEIALERHREWFAARLATSRCHLFVMCAGELPVGQIRFERDGTEARIGYSIDPLFRGRGWGTLVVALGVKQLLNSGPITFRADVKEANVASRSVFGRLGFEESMCHEGTGLRTYRFDPTVRSLPSMH